MKKKWFQHQRGLCCWSGGRLKTRTSLQILLIIIWRLPRCALMSSSPRMSEGARRRKKREKARLLLLRDLKQQPFSLILKRHFKEGCARLSTKVALTKTHQTRSPPRRRRSRSPSRRRSATTATRTCWWLPRSRISPAGTSACLQTGR